MDPIRKKTEKEKWKTSGSKRSHVPKRKYSQARNSKELAEGRNPHFKSMQSAYSLHGGKVNTNYLYRFLQKSVGKRWDIIFGSLKEIIPGKIKEQENIVFWLVADKIEYKEDKVWDKRKNAFLGFFNPKHFYVDPDTSTLQWIETYTLKPSDKKISRKKKK